MPDAQRGKSGAERLEAVRGNAWLYSHERDEARDARMNAPEAECAALADKLEAAIRTRAAQWRAYQ